MNSTHFEKQGGREGADIRSLCRRIENQNRQQNNEFRGEVEPEEDNIVID